MVVLAATLLAVAGLFVHGVRTVDAGSEATHALSVARSVIEEMGGWPHRRIWEEFGFDGTVSAYTVDSRTHDAASHWQQALAAGLASPGATIRIDALGEPGSPPALRDAEIVRITVTVEWSARGRVRRLRLSSTRS